MLPIARISPLRRFSALALAALALALLGVGELGRVGGAAAVMWWADAGWILCSAAAVAGCLVAARRDHASRHAWLLFAAGCATWLFGQIAWDYYQLVAQQPPSSPSLGDAGWLGFVPLFGAGLYFLPRWQRLGHGARKTLFALDVVIVAIALTLDRPYRRGLPVERVVAELRRGAGAQFDPALVEPFIAAFVAAQATTTLAGRHFAPQRTSVPMAQAS